MKKRILITGSAGFSGTHMVEHFTINTDWDIIGIDSFRHRGDSCRITDKKPHQDHTRYQIFTHDLSTPISDVLINKIGHIDYIINNASESHVQRSIDDPVPFVQNNVNLALTMLEYARKIKPEKYIQISTDEVYGAAIEGTSHKEWSINLPSNPYSASKSAMVDISISYWRTYGVPLIITETMNLQGEYQNFEKYIPMTIKKILNGEEVIVHGTPEYIGKRFYLHARNQADAQLFLLKNIDPIKYEDIPDKIIKPSRYNIVGELELDNLQLAQMIADILGKPLKYKFENFHHTRPGHDRRYALDGTKMAEIGWIPPVPFRKSLEKTVAWTLEHPEWL